MEIVFPSSTILTTPIIFINMFIGGYLNIDFSDNHVTNVTGKQKGWL